jgi:large repetitive protein
MSGSPLVTQVIYIPNTNYCGSDVLSYTTKDQNNAISNTGTITINIPCSNSAPTANPDTISSGINEDSVSNLISPLTNDTDPDSGSGDTLSISGIVTGPTNGTATLSGTTEFRYTPTANFCGMDSFTYQARDTF